jgi:hypothetical protein
MYLILIYNKRKKIKMYYFLCVILNAPFLIYFTFRLKTYIIWIIQIKFGSEAMKRNCVRRCPPKRVDYQCPILWQVIMEIRNHTNILSRLPVGSVTNNTTRVRIGYWIYLFWKFTAAHITINYWEHLNTDTGSFLNPAVGTALHWLTDEN